MNLRWKIAQFFEAWWWRRYLRRKSLPEYLAWKRSYWVDFLKKIKLEVPPTGNILDAGCGPAGIFLNFPENQVTAVDPLLGEYRPMFPHFSDGSLRNVSFEEQSLESYRANESFDLVFCLNAINHVANLELCLKNLRNAIRSGGKLVLSVDAHNHTFFKQLFQFLPGDILHPHQLDLEEYLERLAKAGFKTNSTLQLKKEFFFSYYVIQCEV